MKAPVGLLSDRTVLRSKMEGPRPDKFTLTRLDFCGNLSQQFNITYLFRVPVRLPKEPEQVFNFLSLHNEPEPRPSRKGWSGSGCCVAIFLLPNPAPHLENRKTVCMGYTAMTPQGRAGKRRRKGAGKPCRENGRTLIPQLPENNVVKLITLFFCNASERRVISMYICQMKPSSSRMRERKFIDLLRKTKWSK